MKKFSLKGKVASSVDKMTAYTPGEQPQGGKWVKLNTNEMPYCPSPKVREAILNKIGNLGESLRLYPNPESRDLRKEVAKHYNLKEENAFAGNGSDDILNLFVRAFSDSKLSVGTLNPSYSLYPVLTQMQGANFIKIDLDNSMKLPIKSIIECGANLFFLTNPNAPTSFQFSFDDIEQIAKNFKGILLIDEAYEPFAKYSCAKLVKKYANIAVCCTASKGWALAGMRIGWVVANKAIIEVLDKVRDSYNLDSLAQVAAIAALKDKKYYKDLANKIKATRKNAEKFFKELGWFLYESNSNFLFVRPANTKGKYSSKITKELFEFLKSNHILVRYFAKDKSINEFLRISIGTDSDMAQLENTINKWLKK